MRHPETGQELALNILYQDDDVVAVEKPSGLLVHRTNIAPGERLFALQIVRDQIGRLVYPVHRLDRPTSGVLLFGLSSEVGKILTDAFSQGQVQKTYLAIVRGWIDETGTVDSPIGDLRDYTSSGRPGEPKAARSDYRRLALVELPHAVGRYASARYALVEVDPKTGKRHQVRRHLKRIGHPVVGDPRHGDRDHNRFFTEHFDLKRLLLSAVELTFPHPRDGTSISVSCRLDDEYVRILAELGWLDILPERWLP